MAMMKSPQKAAKRIGKELPPPQALSAAARRAAIEGIPVKKARAIAAKEPVSPKAQATKTKNPLAPQRIAGILDTFRKAYPNVVWPLTHHNPFDLVIAPAASAPRPDAT